MSSFVLYYVLSFCYCGCLVTDQKIAFALYLITTRFTTQRWCDLLAWTIVLFWMSLLSLFVVLSLFVKSFLEFLLNVSPPRQISRPFFEYQFTQKNTFNHGSKQTLIMSGIDVC
jgi:uncharacterized protein (DUF58 family)